MAVCKTIVVNIFGYENLPGVTYTAYIRPVGSQQVFGSVDTLTQVATGPTVVFSNLSGILEYEVGVQKTCSNGETSRVVWQNPIDPNCSDIISLTFNDATNTFTIVLPANNISFEWRIDDRPWVLVSADNTNSTRTLTFANISANAYYADGYGTQNEVLYNIQVRTSCSNVGKGVPKELIYTSLVTPNVGKIQLLENICTDGFFTGQLFRISITDQSVVGQNLVYTPPGGAPMTIASWPRTNNLETDIQVIASLVNGFNIQRIVSNDPDERFVSVDFISDIPPQGIERIDTIPCGTYPSLYSIT